MTAPHKQKARSTIVLVGLVLTLVSPCCGGCTSAEPATPSCHGGGGVELTQGDDCCLAHSQTVGEIPAIDSPPHPALLPLSAAATRDDSLLARSTGSSHALESCRDAPLYTLLCTLLR